MLYGKGLDTATGARIVPADGSDFCNTPASGKVEENPCYAKLDGTTSGSRGDQRGVQFHLADNAKPGTYWIQLLSSPDFVNPKVLASVQIYVRSSTPQAPAPGTMPAPAPGHYTNCENGNVEGGGYASGIDNQILYCSYSLLSRGETRDDFGSRVAATYYAIQVGVEDQDAQYDYLLRTVVLTLPDGRRVASRVKRFAQGVAVEGRIHDNRNVVFNSLTWAGSVWGGLSVFKFATTDLKNAANVFQGAGLTGFSTLFPDVSVDNVNRFNNAIFDDQQPLVVPKRGAGQPPLFIVALVPRPRAGPHEQEYLERLGQQITVAVDGTAIQSVNLVTFSAESIKFATPVPLGGQSAQQKFTVTNGGLTPVSISLQVPQYFAVESAVGQTPNSPGTGQKSSANSGAPAAQGSGCSNLIPANATCEFVVSFAPDDKLDPSKDEDAITGNLVISGNFVGSPKTIALTGTPTPLKLEPPNLDFPKTLAKPSSTSPLVLTVTNVRAAKTIPVTMVPNQTADFTVTSAGCLTSLAVHTPCAVTVNFQPQAVGLRTATLNIIDASTLPNKPLPGVSLTGEGTAPIMKLGPSTALSFTGEVNQAIPPQEVTVTNEGDGSLGDVSAKAGPDQADFVVVNNCKDPLPPPPAKSSCTIKVTFKPTTDGAKPNRVATLTVKDSAGDSQDLGLRGSVIVAPPPPTIGTATAGNAQASVTFTAPASDGGAAITQYTVTASPGGRTATGASSPITVTGLTNGTPYTFTVTATNSAGPGPASAASNSVTPNP
ncbi:MAG: choice-of-anchor D domain-containing protein [Terriglobia bacterium]|jgi:hypothetical protein